MTNVVHATLVVTGLRDDLERFRRSGQSLEDKWNTWPRLRAHEAVPPTDAAPTAVRYDWRYEYPHPFGWVSCASEEFPTLRFTLVLVEEWQALLTRLVHEGATVVTRETVEPEELDQRMRISGQAYLAFIAETKERWLEDAGVPTTAPMRWVHNHIRDYAGRLGG